MESAAPISDMITGLTLYCRLVEDIIEGETELTLTEYRMLFFLSMTPDKRARIHTLAEALASQRQHHKRCRQESGSAGIHRKGRQSERSQGCLGGRY